MRMTGRMAYPARRDLCVKTCGIYASSRTKWNEFRSSGDDFAGELQSKQNWHTSIAESRTWYERDDGVSID